MGWNVSTATLKWNKDCSIRGMTNEPKFERISLLNMDSLCCTRLFVSDESAGPVLPAQLDVDRAERDTARCFRADYDTLKPATRILATRNSVFASEAGLRPTVGRSVAVKNPARRALFQLLGVYMPEREAREVLASIHSYKWIEAEKAGRDIWTEKEPAQPMSAAARTWASKHLSAYMQWRGLRAA
jgi:hypothetical protein